MFLRNVGWLSTDYTELYPRRQKSSPFFHDFFNNEDGGDMFLRNVEWLLTDYTALYPRRQNSSPFLLRLFDPEYGGDMFLRNVGWLSTPWLVTPSQLMTVASSYSRPNSSRSQVMLRQTVSRPVYLGVKHHLGPKTRFLLLAVASAVIPGSEFHETHDHILLSQILVSPSLEGQVPVFISSRNRMTQLYPQALGSLFVAYDSSDYGEGIRTSFHTGFD
jgi:hypothetical protein